MNVFMSRMIAAARLDGDTYENVEARSEESRAAIAVVLLASVAAALGIGVRDATGIIGMTLASLLTWTIWVVLTYFIGTRIFPSRDTRSTLGEVFRTTGFSAAPGILRAFGAIPVIGGLVFGAATVWMLFAFVVAVRHALDFTSWGRAFAVCLLTWLIHSMLFFAFVVAAI
jgi:hypothetical protein